MSINGGFAHTSVNIPPAEEPVYLPSCKIFFRLRNTCRRSFYPLITLPAITLPESFACHVPPFQELNGRLFLSPKFMSRGLLIRSELYFFSTAWGPQAPLLCPSGTGTYFFLCSCGSAVGCISFHLSQLDLSNKFRPPPSPLLFFLRIVQKIYGPLYLNLR